MAGATQTGGSSGQGGASCGWAANFYRHPWTAASARWVEGSNVDSWLVDLGQPAVQAFFAVVPHLSETWSCFPPWSLSWSSFVTASLWSTGARSFDADNGFLVLGWKVSSCVLAWSCGTAAWCDASSSISGVAHCKRGRKHDSTVAQARSGAGTTMQRCRRTVYFFCFVQIAVLAGVLIHPPGQNLSVLAGAGGQLRHPPAQLHLC